MARSRKVDYVLYGLKFINHPYEFVKSLLTLFSTFSHTPPSFSSTFSFSTAFSFLVFLFIYLLKMEGCISESKPNQNNPVERGAGNIASSEISATKWTKKRKNEEQNEFNKHQLEIIHPNKNYFPNQNRHAKTPSQNRHAKTKTSYVLLNDIGSNFDISKTTGIYLAFSQT